MYFAEKTGRRVDFRCNASSRLPLATFELQVAGRRAFLDYNDRFELEPIGLEMDRYFKRSLTPADVNNGIRPLGFHFNYSHRLYRLLREPGFARRSNRVEIARAIDVFAWTAWSHFARRVDEMFTPPEDHGGRVLFYTRLWEPDRSRDPEEQERRRRMNDVRIQAVRVLRTMGNTDVGIMSSAFARAACPDLLLSRKHTQSKEYGRLLRGADIGIANEGLRGSPGWKIGEYVAGSKAVISNTITTVIPEFLPDRNYLLFEDPLAIPELVATLRRGKRYRELQHANWEYCRRHLHPDGYFERIVSSCS